MERCWSREDKVKGEVREVLLSLVFRHRGAAETDSRGAFDEMFKRRGHWYWISRCIRKMNRMPDVNETRLFDFRTVISAEHRLS